MEKFFLKLGFTAEKAKEAAEKAAKNDIQDSELDSLIADTITTAWSSSIKTNGKLTEEVTAPSFRAGREDAFNNTKKILEQTLGIADIAKAKDATELSRTLLSLKSAGATDPEKLEAIQKQAKLDAEIALNNKLEEVKKKHQKELTDLKFHTNLDKAVFGAIGTKTTVIPTPQVGLLVRNELNEKYKLDVSEDGSLNRILAKDGTEVMDASMTRKLTNEEILAQVVTPYIKVEEPKPEPQRTQVTLGGAQGGEAPKVGHFK